jgi:hypothetical protein
VDGEVGGAMTMLVGVADRLGEARTDDGGSDSVSVEGAVTHCLTSTSFTGKWLSGRTGDDAASGMELDVETAWPVGADSEDWRRRRRGLWLLRRWCGGLALRMAGALGGFELEAENGRGREWGPDSAHGRGRRGAWRPAEAGGVGRTRTRGGGGPDGGKQGRRRSR